MIAEEKYEIKSDIQKIKENLFEIFSFLLSILSLSYGSARRRRTNCLLYIIQKEEFRTSLGTRYALRFHFGANPLPQRDKEFRL